MAFNALNVSFVAGGVIFNDSHVPNLDVRFSQNWKHFYFMSPLIT